MFLPLPKFDQKTQIVFNKIIREARLGGIGIYLVGGMVRDALLRKKSFDLDIVLEADALGFAKYFSKEEKIALTMHPEFKTATLFLKSGQRIDLSSARKEHYRKIGALPTIVLGDLKDDLSRRDFSINAMALSINVPGKGELVDLFNGYEDLSKRKIRVLHERSFLDDPTRILRAIRYEQRLGFDLERKTLMLLKDALRLEVFNEISSARFLNELKKIFNEADVLSIIKRAGQLKILFSFEKKLSINFPAIRLIQNNLTAEFPEAKEIETPVWFIYFLGMLEGNKQEVIDGIGSRFNFGKQQKKTLRQLNDVTSILRQLESEVRKPSENLQLLNQLTKEMLCYVWYRATKKNVRLRLKQFFLNRNVGLTITVEDIKKMGVKSGRQMGEIMKAVLFHKIDCGLKNRKEELNTAKFLIESN